MSMITELFGEKAIYVTLEEIKSMIKSLPSTTKERNSYLLHDWDAI